MNLPLNTATPSAATKTMQGYLAGLGTVAIWAGFILISRLAMKTVAFVCVSVSWGSPLTNLHEIRFFA
jgi:hypothetical protein